MRAAFEMFKNFDTQDAADNRQFAVTNYRCRLKPVNTETQLIGAAAETFLRLGAASVTVAEGPGHHRDTELLLHRGIHS